MSEDKTVSRKEKKAQRDAERQKKGKKRKREEELQQDLIPLNGDVEGEDVKATEPTKKSSKRKRKAEEASIVSEASVTAPENGDEVATPKPKKRKKTAEAAEDDTQEREQDADAGKPGKSRFILFIGNLPYTTTDSSLEAHFEKLKPFTLRHRTDPKTKKSKGFAFLEFENYDRMKTCIKLYHHSLFDPAGSEDPSPDDPDAAKKRRKQKGARKINVELTAGGGGKAEHRKEKIKAKNVRLDEQRKRRLDEERKVKEKQRVKNAKSGDSEAKVGKTAAPDDALDHTASMHPSRLARLQV